MPLKINSSSKKSKDIDPLFLKLNTYKKKFIYDNKDIIDILYQDLTRARQFKSFSEENIAIILSAVIDVAECEPFDHSFNQKIDVLKQISEKLQCSSQANQTIGNTLLFFTAALLTIALSLVLVSLFVSVPPLAITIFPIITLMLVMSSMVTASSSVTVYHADAITQSEIAYNSHFFYNQLNKHEKIRVKESIPSPFAMQDAENGGTAANP